MKIISKPAAVIITALIFTLSGCANKSVTPDRLSQSVIESASSWSMPVKTTAHGVLPVTFTPSNTMVETFNGSFPSIRVTLRGNLNANRSDMAMDTPMDVIVDGNISLSSDRKNLIISDVYLNGFSLPKLHKPMIFAIQEGLKSALAKEVPYKLDGLRIHSPSDFLVEDLAQSQRGSRVILDDSVTVSAEGVKFQLVNIQ